MCVSCTCCLIEAWYCVDLGSGDEAAYLTHDEACALYDRIGSGPYATEALALAVCPAPAPPAVNGCCPDGLAQDLTVTFTGGTGSCTCLTGLATPLTYNAVSGNWEGEISAGVACPTVPKSMSMRCFEVPPASGNWFWGLLIAPKEDSAAAGWACSPANFVFNFSFTTGDVCSGTVTATVTEAV